ncbi:MAG: hypothetical protein IPP32_16590 [Bacteroidetes bacterium]|nr:hypothetical protein [Bacteroidota bacterium]
MPSLIIGKLDVKKGIELMKKVKCLLETDWKENKLSLQEVEKLLGEYHKQLDQNLFKVPSKKSNIEVLMHLKRESYKIGPWENITPFEAANRIGTDLVLLKGVIDILKKDFANNPQVSVKLRLGISHFVKDPGDFIIFDKNEKIRGEAFNVAESFLEGKLNKTKRNIKDALHDFRYILINGELKEYWNTKKRSIVKEIKWVDNWMTK